MTTKNVDIWDKLDDLEKKFDGFLLEYRMTMYGDAKLNNGDRGVVGTIRELKEYMVKYPSIKWYMANEPRRFWATAAAMVAGLGAIFVKESRDWWLGVLRAWLGL